MMFFGGTKKKDPVEQAKEWKREIQKETRVIERDISKLQREEEKALKECKRLAKTSQLKAAKILAKEVVQTRKCLERMHLAKAQLNSVSMQLQTSVSMIKMTNCIGQSSEIMAAVNQLVKLPEISQTMKDMAREMEKAGLVQELVDDALSSIEPEGIDGEVDSEVDKILLQLTSETLAPASAAPMKPINVSSSTKMPEAEPEVEAADDELAAMQKRLQSL